MMLRTAAIAVAALTLGGTSLRAQAELPSTLSRATRDTLSRLIDSVRVAGFPTEPLVAKASEGVLKRVSEERILWAVRALVRRQAEARSALRPDASAGTLAAAVSALQAGVSAQTIRKLAGSGADEVDLATAFVTLADLVASSVPPEPAAASVEQLLRRRAPEAELESFRASVAQDIASGRAPEAALAMRTQALVRTLESRAVVPPASRTPPPRP